MQTIWKFHVPIVDRPIIQMPRGAKVLSVALQNDGVYLWAVVAPGQPEVPRPFAVVGTGESMDNAVDAKFIGTVMRRSHVWHIFEL